MAAPIAAAYVGGGVGREKAREKWGRTGGVCVRFKHRGGRWDWLKLEGGPKFFLGIDSSNEAGQIRGVFFKVRRSILPTWRVITFFLSFFYF